MTISASDLLPLPKDEGALIPAHRLSAYTGLATQTHARLRCEGRGPRFVKLGRRVFYRAGDVRDWIRAQVRSNTITS